MHFKRLTDLDLRGKRVFIRADLNVPQDDSLAITDDTRIRASVPAIEHCLKAGAAVMVTSHLGRPTEGELRARGLAGADRGATRRAARPRGAAGARLGRRRFAVAPGAVVLLENCRCNKGEKKNDEALSRRMAALCDVYVNDAFGTAHRAEATTHGIARFAPVACAGPLLAAELDALGKALRATAPAAGGDRRRLQGLDQAHDPEVAGRQGRPADRRRRHRQHLPAGGRPADRQVAGRAPTWSAQARAIIDAMAARGASVPLPVDVVVRERVLGPGCGTHGVGGRGRRRRHDPRHRSADRRTSCREDRRIGRHHRLERPGRRVRVRRSSPAARARSRRRSLRRRASRSPAAATPWRRSRSSASPTASGTSPPAAERSSSSSRAANCPRSRRSRRAQPAERRGRSRARARTRRQSGRPHPSSSRNCFCATLAFSLREPAMTTPRATKIVATLGPASSDPAVLERLIVAGVNVVRVNFSHGSARGAHRDRASRARDRRPSRPEHRRARRPAGTEDPHRQVRRRPDRARRRRPFTFDVDCELGDQTRVGLDYQELVNDVKPGDTLLLNDGRMMMRVDRVTATTIECTVIDARRAVEPQGHQSPGWRPVGAGADREGHGGHQDRGGLPGRLRRGLVPEECGRHVHGPRTDARRRRQGADDRQDRALRGDRQPGGDPQGLRRDHGGARRPRSRGRRRCGAGAAEADDPHGARTEQARRSPRPR